MELNPREASLKADFSARLAKIRVNRPGQKSHRDDFLDVARDLFPIYAEHGEEIREFMSRAGKLLSKGKRKRANRNPTSDEIEEMAASAVKLYRNGKSFEDALVTGLEEGGFRYVKGSMGSVARAMRKLLSSTERKVS